MAFGLYREMRGARRPPDVLGPPEDEAFRVWQEVIVDGLCMTVQMECDQSRSEKRYKCVPTLLP